jgi:male-specific lethal 3
VCEDFILKDTPENRKLQRELAEKKQLQLGAYLYRKERKKRKKLIERSLLCSVNSEDAPKKPTELDQELYFSSSTTESHDDDRIFLHIGEILKKNLELDHTTVTRDKIFPKLPATCSVISILEDFVRGYALKVLTKPQQEMMVKPKKIGILNRNEPKMKPVDYDGIVNDINLCKEIADGLRVYFNFILNDFLLYSEERAEMEKIIDDNKVR